MDEQISDYAREMAEQLGLKSTPSNWRQRAFSDEGKLSELGLERATEEDLGVDAEVLRNIYELLGYNELGSEEDVIRRLNELVAAGKFGTPGADRIPRLPIPLE